MEGLGLLYRNFLFKHVSISSDDRHIETLTQSLCRCIVTFLFALSPIFVCIVFFLFVLRVFFTCVVGFLFALWLHYLCCSFLICVVAFKFVLTPVGHPTNRTMDFWIEDEKEVRFFLGLYSLFLRNES